MSQSKAVVKAGVGVIVVHNQRILVGKRKGSHGAGCYAFPGGHIEASDKSLAACGEREILEEVGAIARVFKPDHYRQDLFTTYDILSEDKKKVYVTCYLIAEYLHGGDSLGNNKLRALEENKCEYWEWIDLDQLASLVSSEEQRTWIPVHEVIFYLKQLWGKQ